MAFCNDMGLHMASLHYPNKVIDGTMIVALYLKSVD